MYIINQGKSLIVAAFVSENLLDRHLLQYLLKLHPLYQLVAHQMSIVWSLPRISNSKKLVSNFCLLVITKFLVSFIEITIILQLIDITSKTLVWFYYFGLFILAQMYQTIFYWWWIEIPIRSKTNYKKRCAAIETKSILKKFS